MGDLFSQEVLQETWDIVVNDMPLGRSIDEAIRIVDALQHFEQYGEVCPLGWHPGQEAMQPTHEGVSGYLSR